MMATTNPWLQFVQLLFLVIIFPALWTVLIKWWFSSEAYLRLLKKLPPGVYPKDPHSTSWDWLFSQRKAYWMVVHLKNGEKVVGKLAKNSYSSAFPSAPQLFLEEEWELDENGEFKQPVPTEC